MDSTCLSKNELRELLEEAVTTALINHRELLEEAVTEAILDLKFGLAIEEGDNNEYVAEAAIWAKLNSATF
jgi:hypothetical protein